MNKLHCIGVFSLIMTSAVAMQLPEKSIIAPRGMGNIKVQFDNGDFTVQKGSEKQLTQSCFNDPALRNLNKAKLCALLKNGYIQVKPHGNGYCLDAHQRLNGGGFFGAWAGSILGYGGVTFIGHGLIHGVAALTGPFYAPTAATLTTMCAAPIHAAATAAGVGVGMIGAVATGPV